MIIKDRLEAIFTLELKKINTVTIEMKAKRINMVTTRTKLSKIISKIDKIIVT